MKEKQDAGLSGSDELKIFVLQLNRLYCAKSHLVERLGESFGQINSAGLNLIIDETIRIKEDEIKLMDDFYHSLGISHDFNNCKELINFLEESFTSYLNSENFTELSFLMLLSYLYHIETIEKVSIRILFLLAKKLNIPTVNSLFIDNFNNGDQTLIHELEGRFMKI